MKPFELFKPEDFSMSLHRYSTEADIARIANANLNEWLQAQPVVTSGWDVIQDTHVNTAVWRTNYRAYANPTHSARLVCIEPIAKDTAESVIKALVDWDGNSAVDLAPIVRRARKLLSGEDGNGR